MLKRITKVTGLLVAAASIVSMVPAMAADVKTINTQDGTIYNAEIDPNGAYVDGEINGVDAVYYESNGKFTALDDVDSGSDYISHKGRVIFNDGDYTLDLSNGEVMAEDYWGDHIDDASEALWKNIKDDTDDRYKETDTNDMRTYDDNNIRSLGGAGDWYQTTYENVDADCNSKDEMASLTVYSDQDGNFIDGDYNLGNIKVTTTDSAGKAYDTTIDNTNDAFDVDDFDDSTISAYVTNQNVVDMDNDYLYRTATVTINTTAEGITKINGKEVNGTAFDPMDNSTKVSFNVVQKISKKASSDTIHGVHYANSVTTYVISDKNGNNNSDDYDVIKNSSSQARVSDGKFRTVYTDASSDSYKIIVRTYKLKGTNGFYYLDAEDTKTIKEDAEVDGDGNIALVKNGADFYRLDGGYIYKYDDSSDGDWNKLYKVDGSFDDFVVNSDTNMIAWSEDDEVYSIINETASSDKEEDTTVSADSNQTTQEMITGWNKAEDGSWSYVKADGSKATGWIQEGNSWYYLKADGVMATGWINVNGTWYYCNASGAMLSNTTVDGYVLGANGAWIK